MKRNFKFTSPINGIHKLFAVSLLLSLTNDIPFKQALGISIASPGLTA